MGRMILIGCLLAAQLLANQSFSFSYGGRTYTITTQNAGHVFTWDSSHWTYEPSVILPSPQTNYQYVLIFASGTAYAPQQGIYMQTSYSPTSFSSPPALVLGISATSNLCDMIDARPYWDGSLWHVYVQAIEVCPGPGAAIYEATGPTLNSLSWVYETGTTRAMKIISPYSGTPVGIGEVIQWFNSAPYLGAAGVPIVTTFNDWSYRGQDCRPFNPSGSYDCYEYCPTCAFNGTDVFAYGGPNGTSPMYFWYYRQASSGYFNGQLNVQWPDVILGGSLDAATSGNPGLGFNNTDASPEATYGVGFFPDPVPYANPIYLPYNGGFYFGGYLEGVNGTTGRMSSPRVARNPYGYLDPVPGSNPRRWETYIYYSDQPNVRGGFGASLLTITQQ